MKEIIHDMVWSQCQSENHIFHNWPSHSTAETAKKSLSSIHTATFFHNCNNSFQQFYIWTTMFMIILIKAVVKIVVVCESNLSVLSIYTH